MKKRFELVHDWRSCRKWVSLHCMTLAASIQGTWLYIPEDLRQSIPSKLVTGVTILLMIVGVIGRFINQTKEPKR